MFNLTKTEVLGLDVGSSAVKLVKLRKDDAGYAVTAAGIAEITAGDDFDRTKETIRAIRECVKSSRVDTKLAVCSVRGPEVAVRDFEFPSLSAEEIEGAVLLEASQVCPFNVADGAVDYRLIPNGEDKTRGILVAATETLIGSKVRLAKEAGLKCVLMDVDGLALLNCFTGLDSESENSTAAILNVGGSDTTIAIMGSNGRPFIRDMTYAGNDIVEQLASAKGLSVEEARGLLFGESMAASKELQDSLKKACQKLIVDVTETLRYYVAQEQLKPIEKIFVCGGFALTPGFVELLNSRLAAEAVLWNPFEKIRCEGTQQCRDILETRGPALTIAGGLAMRSI
jgi:type IV pilus assembly protein PilM